ncbi:hypothetical protein N41_0859 [Lactococcus cremoris]|nr:hypothetical protein N41_0859 [Lactococcus cremoris]
MAQNKENIMNKKLKELQAKIEAQNKMVDELENRIKAMEDK